MAAPQGWSALCLIALFAVGCSNVVDLEQNTPDFDNPGPDANPDPDGVVCGGALCPSFDNAEATCNSDDLCVYSCVGDFKDRNADMPFEPTRPAVAGQTDRDGCECPLSTEICDGADNDCDDEIDEDTDLEPLVFQGVTCMQTTPLCSRASLFCLEGNLVCEHPPSYSDVFDNADVVFEGLGTRELICDGEDNNCDNAIDENCCKAQGLPSFDLVSPNEGVDQQNPTIALIAGTQDQERILALWEEPNASPDAESELFFSLMTVERGIIDVDGDAIERKTLSGAFDGRETHPSAASNNDSFAAVWLQEDNGGDDRLMWAQISDAGQATQERTIANAPTEAEIAPPALIHAGDGDFIVTWAISSGGEGSRGCGGDAVSCFDLYKLTPQGDAQPNEVAVSRMLESNDIESTILFPTVAVGPSGGLAAWFLSSSPTRIQWRTFDPSDLSPTSEIQEVEVRASLPVRPDAIGIEGGFALAYAERIGISRAIIDVLEIGPDASATALLSDHGPHNITEGLKLLSSDKGLWAFWSEDKQIEAMLIQGRESRETSLFDQVGTRNLISGGSVHAIASVPSTGFVLMHSHIDETQQGRMALSVHNTVGQPLCLSSE